MSLFSPEMFLPNGRNVYCFPLKRNSIETFLEHKLLSFSVGSSKELFSLDCELGDFTGYALTKMKSVAFLNTSVSHSGLLPGSTFLNLNSFLG